MSEKEFVNGLIVKAPHENAPDFVKCKISIKRKDLGNWLREKSEDWINVDVKVSQEGKWYAEVDTWKPNPDAATPAKEAAAGGNGSVNEFDDDIPF